MLDVLAKLPGTDDLVRDLKVRVQTLGDGAKGAGTAREEIGKLHDQARLAIAREGDVIGAAATAPAASTQTNSNNVTNNTEIHVTVPPGTPADVARGVAGAAKTGAEKGTLRATKAALVPTAG
jgi:hypothetical protein